MAKIVGYIAASLDLFIADRDDKLDWLFRYNDMDFGEHHYDRFIETVDTVVMGRATYGWLVENGAPWAYGDKRVFVVTSSPIEAPLGPLTTTGNVDALIRQLREDPGGPVWMLGGARLQMTFMERGALDEIEIYLMPELLGGGTPLFPPTGFRASPTLISAKAMDRGCVRLHYRFG
ncbi:MAG TPA: dihydrofolate reductase family protein [Devosia sp.]|jgi:dihydrofolate reductase|uniref:dihydrofolate reductase family protein n=1 Tax=Devosia sp. TaxID=1871048 RepID=UPI002F9466C4